LPKGFRKIRHYGILSSRNKKKLRALQVKMDACETEKRLGRDSIIYIRPDFKAKCCPWCGKGDMHIIMRFKSNAPPSQDIIKSLNHNTLEYMIS
jgi:uncharacterized protein CbrC (UPF0167 family)